MRQIDYVKYISTILTSLALTMLSLIVGVGETRSLHSSNSKDSSGPPVSENVESKGRLFKTRGKLAPVYWTPIVLYKIFEPQVYCLTHSSWAIYEKEKLVSYNFFVFEKILIETLKFQVSAQSTITRTRIFSLT